MLLQRGNCNYSVLKAAVQRVIKDEAHKLIYPDGEVKKEKPPQEKRKRPCEYFREVEAGKKSVSVACPGTPACREEKLVGIPEIVNNFRIRLGLVSKRQLLLKDIVDSKPQVLDAQDFTSASSEYYNNCDHLKSAALFPPATMRHSQHVRNASGDPAGSIRKVLHRSHVRHSHQILDRKAALLPGWNTPGQHENKQQRLQSLFRNVVQPVGMTPK